MFAGCEGALRCISVRGGGKGGLVARGVVSGASLSCGGVPCVVHRYVQPCASDWEIAGDRYERYT